MGGTKSFRIPGIDLLEVIYSVVTVNVPQDQVSGGGITFDTGLESRG